MSDWDDCGHHPEWVNKSDNSGACNHPDCKRQAGDETGAKPPHAPSNVGVALDGVGCACGWSAKASDNRARRAALDAHVEAQRRQPSDWSK